MTERRHPASHALLVGVALACLISGCADYSALAYREDDRLTFVFPKESRSTVALPIRLDWEMTDFDVVGPGMGAPSKRAGYFAIFVDRAPIKPGRTLRDVGKGDDSCRRTPGCPDTSYLANRQVYTTALTEWTLTRVLPHRGHDADDLDHEVTVILLDSAGRRIGESSWHREFTLRKKDLR